MIVTNEAPVLRRIATVRRVDALFQAMSRDFLLRQQFITNPIHVLSEYVYGTQIPSDRASVSNQLIYATLSDRELLSWVHFYASEHRDRIPSGVEFVKDFAQAIVDHGGHHAVIALIRSAVAENGLVGFDEDLLHFFFNLGALVGRNDAEGRSEAANIVGPSEKRAEAADGTCTAITWQTWLITKPDVDVDDRFSAGQPSEFGPRYVMVTLDELAIYAAGLRKSGALDLYFSAGKEV
jgi:hypothetical protein